VAEHDLCVMALDWADHVEGDHECRSAMPWVRDPQTVHRVHHHVGRPVDLKPSGLHPDCPLIGIYSSPIQTGSGREAALRALIDPSPSETSRSGWSSCLPLAMVRRGVDGVNKNNPLGMVTRINASYRRSGWHLSRLVASSRRLESGCVYSGWPRFTQLDWRPGYE